MTLADISCGEFSATFFEKAAQLRDKMQRMALRGSEGRKVRAVTAQDVARAVSDRTGIPVGKLTASERQRLLDLEAYLSRHVVGQKEAVAAVAKENWKRLGLKNITCRVGMIDAEALAEELSRVDVAFVDANHTYAGTRMYVNILLEKMHEKSVLVIDDIHHSREMEKVWQEICADDRVTTSMDLYQMGLVFFDSHYWRRDYRMRL